MALSEREEQLSILEDSLPQGDPVPLKVCDINGPMGTIPARSQWPMQQVRKAIEELTGTKSSEQVLISGTEVLSREGSLEDALAKLHRTLNPNEECLDVTLISQKARMGWQLGSLESEGIALLRHELTGFAVELVGASNGWFRILDEDRQMIVWSDWSVSEQEMPPECVQRLREMAEGLVPQELPEEGLQLVVGDWAVFTKSTGILITHAERGEIMLLEPKSMVLLPDSSAQIPSQDLAYREGADSPLTLLALFNAALQRTGM